jgi:HD-GYP domain-containing protein (c-di-GMP phosphodiesterase class II)
VAPSVRLAELVAALSLGIDLGFGQPMEHVLRQCRISMRIGDAIGVPAAERPAVYYTALLLSVGCHSDAHEQAKWFGDDIELKRAKYRHGPSALKLAAASMAKVGAGRTPLHRFRLGLEFVLSGRHEVDDMMSHHAALARTLGEHLALPATVTHALGHAYERWDGGGWPAGIKGDAIPIAARIAQVAEYVEVAHRMGGTAAAIKLAKSSRGQLFDPGLADLLVDRGAALLADLDGGAWDAVLRDDPTISPALTGDALLTALEAIADFVDLKSPYFLGHARATSQLAADAAALAHLSPSQIDLLRHAGLVHGIGRMGISNAILDKRGPLGAGESERVRMQPYLTERMLHQSEGLAPLARIVLQHRERLDGSGYPNRLAGTAITIEARILGAADAYQAMCEPRPHRAALSPDEAAAMLRADARAGRHDADAVEAVLGAAGHRVARRREGPAGLTAREVEVLRLVARGLSNKEVAKTLFISAKTVSNHVEHIYAKIGASSRASASLFAMRNGLLPDHELPRRVRA